MSCDYETMILEYLAVSKTDFSKSPGDVARKVADKFQLCEMDTKHLAEIGPRVQHPETGKTHYDMMAAFDGWPHYMVVA